MASTHSIVFLNVLFLDFQRKKGENKMNVNGLLDQLRHTFHNERDKSTAFEELICNSFKYDPVYASQISDVWMWKDFPRL